MRKYLLIALCFLGAYATQAQSRAGLKLTPNLSFNRVDSQSDTLLLSSNGSGGRMAFGVVLDFALGVTDNYFTTGILFASQRVGVKADNPESGNRLQEVYNLQYLQFPTTFTFITDEIALDKRLYFEVGGIFGVKIAEKDQDPGQMLIRKFNALALSAVLGAGLEFAIGTSTTVSLGLVYYRGLGETVSSHTPMDAPISIKNDQLGLDIAVRF